MQALIGHTGFVGSNLIKSHTFDCCFNSKNIEQAFCEEFDLVVYSGIRAEKFLANQNPEADYNHIQQAIANIKQLKTQKLVLISTIDVYHTVDRVDEATVIRTAGLQPYGYHRYVLEEWVRANVEGALIVRLPALYGANLKKNFIFDMMTIIPAMIKADRFESLQKDTDIALNNYYQLQDNGFYKLQVVTPDERQVLKTFFMQNAFNALSFTDSRNAYQFYPLHCLWQHIEVALQQNLSLLCVNSEPITAGELYQAIFGQPFSNHVLKQPVYYNLQSRHAALFGGHNGYMFDKTFVIGDIARFISEAGKW